MARRVLYTYIRNDITTSSCSDLSLTRSSHALSPIYIIYYSIQSNVIPAITRGATSPSIANRLSNLYLHFNFHFFTKTRCVSDKPQQTHDLRLISAK